MDFSTAILPRAVAVSWPIAVALAASASPRFDPDFVHVAGEAPAGKSLRFSQAQRLQRSWEFERTRLEGQRIVKGCLILNWRSADSEEGQGTPRLGVVTSRKIGNAVARSRARRLLREVFRRHQHDFLQPVDLVLVARQSIAQKSFAQVELDFIAAARQAKLVRGTS